MKHFILSLIFVLVVNNVFAFNIDEKNMETIRIIAAESYIKPGSTQNTRIKEFHREADKVEKNSLYKTEYYQGKEVTAIVYTDPFFGLTLHSKIKKNK